MTYLKATCIGQVAAECTQNIADYEADHAALVEYLRSCVRRRDWHGASDACNDLRVLEARHGK